MKIFLKYEDIIKHYKLRFKLHKIFQTPCFNLLFYFSAASLGARNIKIIYVESDVTDRNT